MKIRLVLAFLALFWSLCLASPHAGHHGHKSSEAKAEQQAFASISFVKYENGRMFVRLQNALTGKPLGENEFKITHTKPLHIFTISDDLTAYTHTHPKAERDAGVYSFAWKEYDAAKNYRIWADVTPKAAGGQEYINFEIGKNHPSKLDTSANTEYMADGYTFAISFDKSPKVAEDLKMSLSITPKPKLEPIMGEFAHVVAFPSSNANLVHIHPMGNSDSNFHINFPKKGFTKIFAQVKIDGKEYFVPFGVNVK